MTGFKQAMPHGVLISGATRCPTLVNILGQVDLKEPVRDYNGNNKKH